MTDTMNIIYKEYMMKPGLRFMFGKENNWWRILEVDYEKNEMLVISEKEICDKAYHDKYENITWEYCTLRKWLNDEYLNAAFSDEEREAIIISHLENPENAEFGINGGNDTDDKIFLLSIDEARKYFKDDEDRATGNWWGLRSPGGLGLIAANVRTYGRVDVWGYNVNNRRGVRPAFRLNLESQIFKSLISGNEKNRMMRVSDLVIKGEKLVSASNNCEEAEIPEGVTEISDGCFENHSNLKSVAFPSTLKKVGNNAFSGCENLDMIAGSFGTVSYGKYVFKNCNKLIFIPEMFRTLGKLSDEFAEHLDVCGSEELAWLFMYQKGKAWDSKLPRKLTKDNITEIFSEMIEYITGLKKNFKKPVENCAAFVKANNSAFDSEQLKRLINLLQEKKLTAVIDSLMEDPAVLSGLGIQKNNDPDERIMPNGAIWYGHSETELSVGATFQFGSNGTGWLILEVDEEKKEMLVISEKEICDKAYHDKYENITWEYCTLRKWLNDEYLNAAFSDEEREAIIISHLENPENAEFGINGGNDTDDKIFLLSIDEARKYFKDDEDRATGNWWGLRSPGGLGLIAANVRTYGRVDVWGYNVNNRRGVRPAFRLNLESQIFKSLITERKRGGAVADMPMLVIRNGSVIFADRNVVEVALPEYVKKIDAGAFDGCRKLERITWTGKMPVIDRAAFRNCPKLRLPAEFYLGTKFPADDFARYMPAEPGIIACILLKFASDSEYFEITAGVDGDAKITVHNVCDIADELLLRLPEIKTVKEPEIILRFVLAAAPVLGKERLKKFKTALNKIKLKGVKWKPLLNREVEKDYPAKDVISMELFTISSKILYSDWEELDRLPRLAEVINAVSVYAEEYWHGSVETKEYKKAALDSYESRAEKRALATEMDHKALISLLKKWTKDIGPEWYAPYAAFANDEELTELLDEMKTWEKEKSLREQIIRVRGAMLLNETITAMRYADKMNLLGRYAKMRNSDEDEIRDNIISDFGLDIDGKRTWVLAGKTLTAAVNRDLTVSLTDENGKVLKSVPKKGADSAEYEIVNKEFTDLKKGVRPTAKIRNDRIFNDFLSGRDRNSNSWKNAYLKNPVLRILASLIVWEQDGITFTLNEKGDPVTVDGEPYTITNQSIKIAHPMEMGPETTEEWQRYFNDNDLKQPFEQVWEPVVDQDKVKPGRYDGCTIPLYMLMNKEKHGIIMEGQSRITLKGCSAGLKLIEGHHDWYNNDFEISDFKYDIWNRQVNHIVTHLDKGTVAGRVKKDDITVVQWFDRFTLAQIMEFIDIASEAQAHNVLAQLMEYKDIHYENYDPMDEFTLEL